MVTGDAVARLLRVCDPDHTLPVADSVREAIEMLDGEPPPATAAGPGAELATSRAAATRASVRCRRARRSESG